MRKLLLLPIGLSLLVAGCGSGGNPAAVAYHPQIDPSNFTTRVTNRYWPMKPGTTFTFSGHKEGKPQRVVVAVKRSTRTIMGVKTITVQDTVSTDGKLTENTTDWYAQDRQGNVWYFGEASKDYEKGRMVSTHGSWVAGIDGARPGIVMRADPKPGPTYRQEFRPGVAEDMAKVLSTGGAAKVRAGRFGSVVTTFESTPLEPGKVEHKYYAPGVGLVRAKAAAEKEEIRLVKVTRR